MALHERGVLKLFPTSFESAVIITGVKSQSGRTGLSPNRENTSGQVTSHAAFFNQSAPEETLEILDVARLIDAVGLSSLNLAAGSNVGAVLYGTSKPVDSLRGGDGTHAAWTAAAGRTHIARLTCEQGGDLTASLQLMAISSDGTTIPISTSVAATLPTIPTDNQRFTIGPVQIGVDNSNKVSITQIQRVEIDFGIRANFFYGDGYVHPTAVSIDQFDPVIRIVTADVAKLVSSGIPLNGRPFDSSHTYVYFRKRFADTSATFVDANTAEHIKFTPYAGLSGHMDFVNAGGNGNATATIELHCTSDASNPSLGVDTTSAISL